MKTTATVVDFGTNKVVTVIAESGSFSRCDIRGTGTVPYTGYQDGEWIEPDELSKLVYQSMGAAAREAEIDLQKIREVFVTVPADCLKVQTVNAKVDKSGMDRNLTEDDMDAALDTAAGILALEESGDVVIARSPAWFRVDDGKPTMTPLGNLRSRGNSLSAYVSFVTANRKMLGRLRELFAGLHMEIAGFVCGALSEALTYIPPEERDRSAALLDVGYLNTEFSVVQGDALLYHKVIPIGGGMLTADLDMGLQIDMNTAERLKRKVIFGRDELSGERQYIVSQEGKKLEFSPGIVHDVLRGTMNDLLNELEDAIAEAGPALKSHACIYLTGGGLAPMPGFIDWLADQLNYSVKGIQAQSAKLNGYCFTSVLGVMDQVFDTIEPLNAEQESFTGRLMSGVKGFLHRGDREEPEEADETDDNEDNGK